MAIKYRMYQDNRKNSKNKGAWYARAYSPALVGMKELATRINNTCTVTESDVLAVITALVVEMKYSVPCEECLLWRFGILASIRPK